MFDKSKWPFTPVNLSEIINKETLAVIESGCCERLGRPLTILDYDPHTGGFSHRIESINEIQRYETFCRFLRNEPHVSGGDEACKRRDIEQARESLQEFHSTGDPYRVFRCHMGLVDMTYIVRIGSRPVALLFSGQYCPPEGTSHIQAIVNRLGTGLYSHIQLGESEREQLLLLAQQLPALPADARERLEREARHIQSLAEAELERRKYQWEQDFLHELRRTSIGPGQLDRHYLQRELRRMLESARQFCRCEYMVFFGSVQEASTVLAPLAEAGVPPAIAGSLPHFNWKKAELPLDNFDRSAWDIGQGLHGARSKGIRGSDSEFFSHASCILPLSLGNKYRGVLACGPFVEPVDLQAEQQFLLQVADTIGSFALTGLEILNLERERRRWRSTATLLTHQLRTTLTPITAVVGRAKLLAQKSGSDGNIGRLCEFLTTAEDLSKQLSQKAKQTLEGHVVQLEPEDLDLERFPLSVLVVSCAEGFGIEARKRHRNLVIDKSVEQLPEAEVDVARLTIALSNLIDNAIKYSYPNTTIYIRADRQAVAAPNRLAVVIEVDDIGDEIRPELRERIFEEGTRGLTKAKMGRISGSGLGLWEARSVINAHGGEIGVMCKPTAIQRRQGTAYRVIFSAKVPLNQTDEP